MKTIKLIVAIILIIGVAMTAVGFIAAKGDLTQIVDAFSQDDDYELKNQTGSEFINQVEISGSTHSIHLSRSEDANYELTYYEAEYDYFNFSITNGVLILDNVYKFGPFRWGYKSPAVSLIEVVLPMEFAGSIVASTGTGTIDINDFSALTELDLSSGTGSIHISNCQASTAILASTSTGSVSISDCQSLKVDGSTSTGDVVMDAVNALEISASCSTGGVELTDIISDDISASSSTGSIILDIIGVEEDYRVQVATSTGDITFQGVEISDQTLNPAGSKSIIAETSTGSISINIG
ncbi:MAG TPA: hypothetical protein DD618_03570 [Acholeplasmatales bacterium]|nr:hypothetical protein [Acholeplasmatales bacterium]